MNIQHITSQSEWNAFFESVHAPSFHHSWEWGLFQQACGRPIIRLGIYHQNKLIAVALVVKIVSKRGKYLFIPHGPLFAIPAHNLTQHIPPALRQTIQDQLALLTDFLVAMAKSEGFWFIRIAPPLTRDADHAQLFSSVGFRKAPVYVHAETMNILDITQSEEELLAGMRKNTRYYIRRAQKDGLTVQCYDSLEALDHFLSLYHITSLREQFQPYTDTYIKREFESFHTAQNALFFLSGFQNSPKNTIPPKFAQQGTSQILAASLVIFSSSCGFYHQGASVHSQYPAAYLLQWESIREAKRRGCNFYSFHGVYDAGRTPQAWKGLSLFKRGFGGFDVNYMYTQDYVVSPAYYLSFAFDTYLNWKRGV